MFIRLLDVIILAPAAIRCATWSGTTFGDPSFPEFIQFLADLFIRRFRFFHFRILFWQKFKAIPSHIFTGSCSRISVSDRIPRQHPVFLNLLKSNVKFSQNQNFYMSIGSTCHISFAYSEMARSDEKYPTPATFAIALTSQRTTCRYKVSTCFCVAT